MEEFLVSVSLMNTIYLLIYLGSGHLYLSPWAGEDLGGHEMFYTRLGAYEIIWIHLGAPESV